MTSTVVLCGFDNGHDDDNQDNRDGCPNDNAHLEQCISFIGKTENPKESCLHILPPE